MSSDPLIDTEFATFKILERIKPGGMAIVYRAFDTERNIIVALKILQENLAIYDEIVSRFEQEARIAADLRHPHIVQFFQAGNHQGRMYIAMEYMAGGSLADYVSISPQMPLSRTLEILEQIGGALDYAHRNNIVHRDLKLGNILLDENNKAMLTDFGIARLLDTTNLTQTGQQMPGTVKYMSPEQASGLTTLDKRSDLYSLGVIAYLMSVGRYPFTGVSDIVIINQHLNMQPPSPSLVNPDLPPAVDAVLLKAMEKEADARYQTADEFVTAFKEAIAGYEAVEVTINMRADNPGVRGVPQNIGNGGSIPSPLTITPTTNSMLLGSEATPAPTQPAQHTQQSVTLIGALLILVLTGIAVIATLVNSNNMANVEASATFQLVALQTQAIETAAADTLMTQTELAKIGSTNTEIAIALAITAETATAAAETANAYIKETETAAVTETAVAMAIAATQSVTATFTPTYTPTATPTATFTSTPSETPTQTPTTTFTFTPTATATATFTLTPTITPSLTFTPTITPSETPTMTPTATVTPSLTLTPSLTPRISPTPTIEPTQDYGSPRSVLEVFQANTTRTRFNCKAFIAAYNYLEYQIKTVKDAQYDVLSEVLDPNSVMPDIYAECLRTPDAEQTTIPFELYFAMDDLLTKLDAKVGP